MDMEDNKKEERRISSEEFGRLWIVMKGSLRELVKSNEEWRKSNEEWRKMWNERMNERMKGSLRE